MSRVAFAGLFLQHSFIYYAHSDNVENYSHNRLNNFVFLGASFDKKDKFYIGQSLHSWSKDHAVGSANGEIGMTELGPRIIMFFNEPKTWYFSFAWHPYAKRTRTVDSESHNISGSSYMGTLGYQLKITKMFYLGGSLNYHLLNISTQTVDNTESTVTHSYTTIYPMVEFSLRFR